MKKVEVVERLELLLNAYGEEKAELDAQKKVCDDMSKEIKAMMIEAGVSEVSTDFFKAKLVTAVSENMNEEQVLEWAHGHEFNDVIQTKEVINFDRLEGLIYSGAVPQDWVLELDKFRTKKETTQLRMTAKK